MEIWQHIVQKSTWESGLYLSKGNIKSKCGVKTRLFSTDQIILK